MEYTELDIRLKETYPYAEILVAQLNEIDFESYAENANGVKAYVQTHLLNKTAVHKIITEIKKRTELSFNISKVKEENWNKKWEMHFQPVHINERCVVRAHFHDVFPEKEYDIMITPKMSFGTGHHETTALVMNEMFEMDFNNKSVLDIGSGTGILAILASKFGARSVLAVDIHEWAYKNGIENALLNDISNIDFIHGKVDKIQGFNYDIVLANINRNLILQDIKHYVTALNDNNSEILLSGFLKKDIPLILDKSEQLGLQLVCSKNKNKWQMLHLKRD